MYPALFIEIVERKNCVYDEVSYTLDIFAFSNYLQQVNTMKQSIWVFGLLLASCGGDSVESGVGEDVTSKTTSRGGHSCLWDMATQPEAMLSLEEAASLADKSPEQLKQRINTGTYSSVNYSWKGGRKHDMNVGNNTIEIEVNDFIAISIKPLDEKALTRMGRKGQKMTYLEYFDTYHGGITELDKEAIARELDEQEAEHREVAKEIMGMVKFQGFQTHDDLGDKANSQVNASAEKISGLRQTELAFVHGDVVILVATDVSDKDAADLELARATASTVLSKCK